MKTILTILFIIFNVINTNAQTDLEIGSVYINRAEQNYLDNEMKKARENFDKAILYIKEINDSHVARIGTLLSYDIKDYTKAKILAERYFELEPEKDTDEFLEMLELSVTIREAISAKKIEDERKQLETIRLKKETRHLDSITNLWNEKSLKFYVDIDSIGEFNKYNVAIYKSSGNLGVIDDFGNIIITADTYPYAIEYDGYILFTNDIQRPSRVFCYNASTKESFQLPNISVYDPQAYDYGKIMLPRINGMLVMYPENIKDVVVFDLNSQKFQDEINKKELFKTWKKNDIIDKYDKDLNIRIEKKWYAVGTSIGGGFYPIFSENKALYGFLSESDGRIFTSDYYSYLGAFCDGKFETIENGIHTWMNAEGIKSDTNINHSGVYSGSANFIEAAPGKYQIIHNKNGKDILILGDESLLLLEDYIDNLTKK